MRDALGAADGVVDFMPQPTGGYDSGPGVQRDASLPFPPAPASPRVLQLMAGAAVGGIETFFFDGVLALAEAGIPQFVVTRPNTPFQLGRLSKGRVPFATAEFHSWWRLPTARVLAKTIAEFNPDIIQYWTGRAASYGKNGRARNVGWYSGYRSIKRFRFCDRFIGITEGVKSHIQM